MRRCKPKTREDEIIHFQKRCLERIGIILSQRTLKELKEAKKLLLLEKQSNTRNIYRLRKDVYNGKQMLQYDVVLVYDKTRQAFVTTWRYDEWLDKHGFQTLACNKVH